jgi:hypothetical protein
MTMTDEREDLRTKRTPDSRIQYGQLERADEGEPAPYDVAPPGTPEDKIIKKGERERPGPTADELEADTTQGDGLPRTNEADRQGGATLRRGNSAPSREGDLGGHELQRQNNQQYTPDSERESGDR